MAFSTRSLYLLLNLSHLLTAQDNGQDKMNKKRMKVKGLE